MSNAPPIPVLGHPEMQAAIRKSLAPFFLRAPVLLDLLDELKAATPPAGLDVVRYNVGQALMRRTHATFQAVVIVATNGYGQDALFLVRSLFEAAVTAKYLAAQSEQLQDFWDYGRAAWRRYVERLEATLPGSVPSALLAQHRTPEIDALVAKFSGATGKLKKSWNGKSLDQLASDPFVNEGGRYAWLYGPLSDVGHGQVMGVWSYFDQDTAGNVTFDEKPSEKEVGLALTAGIGVAIEACAGIAVLLDILDASAMTRIAGLRADFEVMNAELEALEQQNP